MKTTFNYSMIKLFIFLLATASFNTFALGKLGHQLVCELAYQHLSPAKQHNIDKLLSLLPKKEKHRINKYNYRPKNEPINFAKACTWADAIKHNKKYKHLKAWHYINVPRNTKQITPNILKKHCKANCITHAITTHAKQFHTTTHTWQKTQALMLLGHWLGDLHQPLHVSFASDLGGNKNKIKSTTKCKNLHWYWDECLLTTHKKPYEETLKDLNQQWRSSPIKQWQNSTLTSWTNGSFQLIKEPSFLYCEFKNTLCKRKTTKIQIGDSYHHKYSPILQKQIIKAAARLVAIIDTA